jgi:hypothetical protein
MIYSFSNVCMDRIHMRPLKFEFWKEGRQSGAPEALQGQSHPAESSMIDR